MRLSILIGVIGLIALVNGSAIKSSPADSKSDIKRYDNFAVYKLHIKNKTQLAVLRNLAENSEKYNIWKDYDEVSKEVHLMISPDQKTDFIRLLHVYGFGSELIIENVQDLIDEEKSGAKADNGFGWTSYYELHEIEAWLDGILAAYPSVTEGFTIGKSTQGRTIRGIKISHKAGNPGIFIESNIHAREWITSASATWFINQLLTSDKPEVRNLAENYDWHIIPVFNVDGFVHSHDKDRMWRKTRTSVSNSNCIGTDANRNFDSHWMANGGASNNPCSETFAGPVPFSEPEAKALADYLTNNKGKYKLYLSFHSYGQYLLSPYGHSKDEKPPNYDDLQDISAAFVAAIKGLSYGTQYTHGSTAIALYVASGSSVDWVYNTLDVKIGYTIEFRDNGRFGFVLPPVQILPNCEELMAGMLALVARTKDLGYFN